MVNYIEPSPQIELRKTGKTWHIGKVLFEQWWLALTLGGKALGVPLVI